MDQAIGNPAIIGIIVLATFTYLVCFPLRRKKTVKARVKSFVDIVKEKSPKVRHAPLELNCLSLMMLPKQFPNDVYKLAATYGDLVIIPPAYVEGLKALPESQLSFHEMNHDVCRTPFIAFLLFAVDLCPSKRGF